MTCGHSHVTLNGGFLRSPASGIPVRKVGDNKEVIRIRISKENRQHNGQKKKYKQRSTKHTHKTKDLVTRTPLKTGGELRCSGRVAVPAPLVTPVVLIYLQTR
jgi:hypothetical protein